MKKLTKAHMLKVFRKKYKAELAYYTAAYGKAAVDMKTALFITETEDLYMRGLISEKELEGWKSPFTG